MKKRMKLLLSLVAAVGLFAGSVPASYAEVPAPIDKSKLHLSLEVLVNARKVAFPDVKPVKKNERILVPLRFVSDKLGGKLSLVGRNITIVKGDRTVKLTIGAKSATANGKTIPLDVAADAVNGRTLVPLRFISEALGESVEWDELNQFVWIGSKDVPDVTEAVKASDIKPYLKYYNGTAGEFIIQDENGNPFTTARVIGKQDLPLKIGRYTYFRMDRVLDTKGVEHIRLVSTEKNGLARPLSLLRKGKPTRDRGDIDEFREEKNGVLVQYYDVINILDKLVYGDKDYEKVRLKNVNYLGIYTDLDEAILFKMDFLD
jgi:hypothetical protein